MEAGPGSPLPLHERALHDLRYIRTTMERAGSFTAVPGWGGVGMGLLALLAALTAALQPTPGRWLLVWLVTAPAALAVGLLAMARKARRAGGALLTGPGRKFALGFAPPLVAGALLTAVLWQRGDSELLPGVWLLLYGTGVVTAGAASVRIVPVMGTVLMVLGLAALFTPPLWGDAWLAAGFGLVQAGFGIHVARRHGG
jgi:hypothetical protein